MTMDMTVKEYFEDEENMNRVVDEMIAKMKPYNDKYDELLANENRIFDIISINMFDMALETKERFCLNDYEDSSYEPREWVLEHSLLEVKVWFDILINMGKSQKYSSETEHMFQLNEYMFVFNYCGNDFMLETFAGQGQYLYTLRALKRNELFTQINLKALKEYEKEQREKYEKESSNQ